MTKEYQLFVEPSGSTPTFKKSFEIVERKGIGHPDTICDLMMEEVEIALSRLYLEVTGSVQHHNMDKALLVAGQSENKFGGGKVTKPMRLVVGDRATFDGTVSRRRIEETVTSVCNSWFENNMRYVRKNDVEYQLEIGQASGELRSIFSGPTWMGANDTSALVGYAPMTETENSVLQTEEFLNSGKFKSEFCESGEDIKVMGFRNKDSLELTIAMAFVDSWVPSEGRYFQRKSEMVQTLEEFHRNMGRFRDVRITMNNLDRHGMGLEGLYLTVLGTSADNSDSGQVGRGNRANRLISLSRPAGSEAIAGKNAVSHIGKIYNMMCFKIAAEIYREIPDLEEVFVWMYNSIGRRIDHPKAVVIQSSSKSPVRDPTIEEIVAENISGMDEFCKYLMSGKALVA